MLKIVEGYQYLYDVIKIMLKRGVVPFNELNLVGGRKSAKSVSIQATIGMIINLPIRCAHFAFRASEKAANELFNDIRETLKSFEIPFKSNKIDKTINGKFGEIRVIGLNSLSKMTAQKAGLSRVGNVDYIIKYFEERFEFETKDYQALQETVRGMNPKTQMITINVCNPWAKSSPYIKYCASFQPWNQAILEKTGSQFGIYTETDPETGDTYTRVFHYTNWRIAKEVLSKSEIAELKNTRYIDRNRAVTTDLGLPGYEFGSIYAHLLSKISPPLLQADGQFYVAGMDWGWSQRDNGGKTVCNFGTANLENGVDLLYEYVHDNAKKPRDTDSVCQEIVRWYKDVVADYGRRVGLFAYPRITVRVDNMNLSVIEILNKYSRIEGSNKWLRFTRCMKYPIQDRIELTTALMGGLWLRIDSKNCANLLEEFEMSYYEEVETQKRVKKNDHSINAFEYGIEQVMYKLAGRLGMTTLAQKERIKYDW